VIAGHELYHRCDSSQRHHVRNDLQAAETDGQLDGQRHWPAGEASTVGHLRPDHGGETTTTDDVERVAGWRHHHQRQPHRTDRLGGKQSACYTRARGARRCRSASGHFFTPHSQTALTGYHPDCFFTSYSIFVFGFSVIFFCFWFHALD